ncbi:hypothetical protein [Microbacterium immunditiarum]|uniref:Uncharacterized protein n=1 Tax=Microbacterium immunditiarum TaxID=337480 RepID=A0A7Y9KLM8_9MICO|nr:hypothetical protein [Microbacterium immunditiarum]NYE20423.1 hypothetical protein [Microbacterium immunditiarum]
MTINAWWRDRPEERYWMIAPSGGVVGDALIAPKADDDRRFEFIGAPDTLAPAPAYIAKMPRDLVALLSSRFGFEFAL